ncbi:MAG: hypothetical protein JW963_15800 [Anaerolineales bacterium]|nr:hypothetical protein [Anaerolineales bacterium]
MHIDLITDEMIVFDDEILLDTSNMFSNFSISGTSEGIIWLFGERGLEIYNNGIWTNIVGSSIQGLIYDIYEAQNGDVWFVGNGIYKYSPASNEPTTD